MESGNFEKLNECQASIAALKSLLLKRIEFEKEIETKIFSLQIEYQEKYNKLNERSKALIEGSKPTKEECEDFFKILPEGESLSDHVGMIPPHPEPFKGINNYWLTVLKNFPHTGNMITKEDEDVLKHLTDVRSIQFSPDAPGPEYITFKGYGLVLEFHFSPNNYFKNAVLYKCYCLQFVRDPAHPYDFDGYMPVELEVSKIDWLPEKNLTVKIVSKTQRNKKTKQTRVITKTEKQNSIFNFFARLEDLWTDDLGSEEDKKIVLESLLVSDYDLASEIQSEMIPKSAIFYLDEGPEDSCDEDDGCIEEMDDDDSVSEGTDMAVMDRGTKNKGHGGGRHGLGGNSSMRK